MKKFIKGKWFAFIILVIAETALFVFLYCNDFRITYAPNLENSWIAVSAFAAWTGVAMSFSAMIIAILIPKKIADRQDKIALFEKRYIVYSEIQKIKFVSDLVENKDANSQVSLDILLDTILMTMEYPPLELSEKSYFIGVSQIQHTNIILGQSSFLFPEIDTEDVENLLDKFMQFLMVLMGQEVRTPEMNASDFTDSIKDEFLNVARDFSNKYLKLMESRLIFKE